MSRRRPDEKRKAPRCKLCQRQDGWILPATKIKPAGVVRVLKTKYGYVCADCASLLGVGTVEELERVD